MDARRMAEILAELLSRTGPAAPLLLFLAAFVEYVFPPFPGDLLVVLGAWYATHGALSWPVTFAAVTLGAVLGAALDWRVGRWLGARIGERAAAGRLDRQRVLRFEAAYRRWGALLLVANRFLPGIRAFFFLAAGASGIALWEVLLYGGLSAALWNGLLLAAGAYLVRNQAELVDLVSRYNAAVMGLLLLALLAGALWLWRARRRSR